MTDDEVLKLNLWGWPIPDTYLTELGRLSALWTTLEFQLDMYLGKIAGFNDSDDPRAFILLKHSSFPQKLDSFSALCGLLAPDYPNLAGYKSAVGRIRSAQRLRNRFAHNSMSEDQRDGTVRMGIGSARGMLKTSVEPVNPADVRRAAMEVHLAMLDLHALITGKRYAPKWESGSAPPLDSE